MKRHRQFLLLPFIIGLFLPVFFAKAGYAAPNWWVPKFTFIEPAQSNQDIAFSLQILMLFTILSLAPSILLMMTSFTRLIIVFSFLRHALGTQQLPPNQIFIGLALFITMMIMGPVFKDMNENAVQPFLAGKITIYQAVEEAHRPLKAFMLRQVDDRDLALFLKISKTPIPAKREDVPMKVLIPSFVLSELRAGFIIGFLIYIPFLIIDLVVASILMSMGMMMLPPILISLPFKILLFVLVDGWNLMVKSLAESFR